MKSLFATLALAFASAPTAAAVAPVEAHLQANGVKVLSRFEAPSGMTGIVAEAPSGQRRVMYITADGQTLIHGAVFDARGTNLTEQHAREVSQDLPSVRTGMDAAKRRAVLDSLSSLEGIVQGATNARRTIYAIIDPQCPHCHDLGDALQAAVKAGRVRVVWLPAPVLTDASEAQAAQMYMLPPAQAVDDWLGDRLPVDVRISDDVRERLARNLLALRDTGHSAVPLVVARTSDGSDVLVSVGAPSAVELANFIN